MNSLKEARQKKNLTLEALAEKAAVHYTLLSLFERGKREPGPAQASRIAKALGVSKRTVFVWYLNAVLLERKPALVGNTKLRVA